LDEKTGRTLTLLAKTLQNLANLVEFGQKEPYMLPMNEMIQRKMPEMKQYLLDIAVHSTLLSFC
jgi:Ras GTPase-activating protein 1